MSPPFVLAAGGTGGHVFPAEALAGELLARGRSVHLLCDGRADAFARRVPEVEFHHVRAGRFGGGPGQTVYGLAGMAMGVVQARRLLRIHPLRAADALQLSAAVIASEHRPTTLSFVTLDNNLERAARREGFICAVCLSTLIGRIAAERRHVADLGHARHSGLVR